MNGSKALIDFKEYSRYSNTKEKETRRTDCETETRRGGDEENGRRLK